MNNRIYICCVLVLGLATVASLQAAIKLGQTGKAEAYGESGDLAIKSDAELNQEIEKIEQTVEEIEDALINKYHGNYLLALEKDPRLQALRREHDLLITERCRRREI